MALLSRIQARDDWFLDQTNDPRIKQISLLDTRSTNADFWDIKPTPFSWGAEYCDPIPDDGEFAFDEDASVFQALIDARDLERSGRDREALRIVYRMINELLSSNEISLVNTLLSQIDPAEFSVDFLLGILTVTLRFHPQLSMRRNFFDRVQAEFHDRGANEEGLLVGLG